ncbi:hypothetical protein ACDY96_19485 [Rhizobium mongolense]
MRDAADLRTSVDEIRREFKQQGHPRRPAVHKAPPPHIRVKVERLVNHR